MSDRSPATSSRSSSSRRKRHRNRPRGNAEQDSITDLCKNPTFANALRAWLTHVCGTPGSLPLGQRSATKFVKTLLLLCVKGTGNVRYVETTEVTADTLVQWVEDLAWCLNVKLTVKEDAGKLRTPTSRIGENFRSLINFLAHQSIFRQSDLQYLTKCCDDLEEDLERTSRINRVMELYTHYVQETFFDPRQALQQSQWCEYEVEKVHRRSLQLELRMYNEEEGEGFDPPGETLTAQFPSSLIQLVKVGDILTLQLCHSEEKAVWLPYMYSGFTPTRGDDKETPTDSREISARTPTDPDRARGFHFDQQAISTLQDRLGEMRLSSGGQRLGTIQTVHSQPTGDLMPQNEGSFDGGFDDNRFTEEFFRSWEGDIDSDEDLSDLVDDEQGQLGDFYRVLRQRHS